MRGSGNITVIDAGGPEAVTLVATRAARAKTATATTTSGIEIRRATFAAVDSRSPEDLTKAIRRCAGSRTSSKKTNTDNSGDAQPNSNGKSAGDSTGGVSGRVIVPIGRGSLVLKGLTLPANISPNDLPSAVRLVMERQPAVAAGSAVIDFIPFGVRPAEPGSESEMGPRVYSVLAAAVPKDELDAVTTPVRECGGKPAAAPIRSEGLATLVRAGGWRGVGAWADNDIDPQPDPQPRITDAARTEQTSADAESILGVWCGPSEVEFVVLDARGRLLMARHCGLDVEDREIAHRRAATEAKRTWMTALATPGVQRIGRVSVVGSADDARGVALACSESIGVPSGIVDLATLVRSDKAIDLDDLLDKAAPAVGLALAAANTRKRAPSRKLPKKTNAASGNIAAGSSGGVIPVSTGNAASPDDLAGFNFLSPRSGPDKSRGKRLAMMAAGFALVVVMGLITTLRTDLQRREARLAALRSQGQEVMADYQNLIRLSARAEHAERFAASSPAWGTTLSSLLDGLPAPPDVLLDRLVCAAEPQVVFTRGRDNYLASGDWTTATPVRLSITGRSTSRSKIDAARNALVLDERYTLTTRGPDVPGSFDWVIITDGGKP